MNELLQSLRADLLSRRMLPFAVASLVALVAAVGYALTSGGSTQPPFGGPGTNGSAQPAALAVSAASPNPNAAESETPGGARYQSGGPTRNPFTPLSQPKSSSPNQPSAKAPAPGGSPSPSPGGSGSGGGVTGKPGTGGGSGGEPPTPPKPSKPVKKSRFPYDVSILFGQLPATAGQEVTLPPYQNLQPQRPLPSATNARIALERVNPTTQTAVFTLLAPAIPRGQGICLPSPSECQQVGLKAGQIEELEYLEETGQTAVYELKTVSIVKRSSQAAG